MASPSRAPERPAAVRLRRCACRGLRSAPVESPAAKGVVRREVALARAKADHRLGVHSLDLGRELKGHAREIAERAGNGTERDTLHGVAQLGDGCVEPLPKFRWAAPRARARAQLVAELHVSRPGYGPKAETHQVRVAECRGLLLGRLGDRANALAEGEVGRRFDARAERLIPARVGEPDLLDGD